MGQPLPEVDPTAFHILTPHWSPSFLCESSNNSKKSYWNSDLIPLLRFSISISRAWSWPLLWPYLVSGNIENVMQGESGEEKDKLFESCSILRLNPSHDKLWCERRKPCERKTDSRHLPDSSKNPSASRPHFPYRGSTLLYIFIVTIFNFQDDSFHTSYSDQYSQLGNLCSVGRI